MTGTTDAEPGAAAAEAVAEAELQQRTTAAHAVTELRSIVVYSMLQSTLLNTVR